MIAIMARVEQKYAKCLEEFPVVYCAVGKGPYYYYYLNYKITTKTRLAPFCIGLVSLTLFLGIRSAS